MGPLHFSRISSCLPRRYSGHSHHPVGVQDQNLRSAWQRSIASTSTTGYSRTNWNILKKCSMTLQDKILKRKLKKREKQKLKVIQDRSQEAAENPDADHDEDEEQEEVEDVKKRKIDDEESNTNDEDQEMTKPKKKKKKKSKVETVDKVAEENDAALDNKDDTTAG